MLEELQEQKPTLKFSVAFGPSEIKPTPVRGACVVLVDVWKSASAVSAFLFHGAAGVQLWATPAAARKAFGKEKRATALLAGEQDFRPIASFHLGGADSSHREKLKGKKVFLVSEWASVFSRLKEAHAVYFGAFVNLSAVYDALLKTAKPIFVVLPEGSTVERSLDAVFAGQLLEFLRNTVGGPEIAPSQSAQRAADAYRSWQGRLDELARCDPRGKGFWEKKAKRELDILLRPNRFSVVPVFKNGWFVLEEASAKPAVSKEKQKTTAQKGKPIKVKVPLFPKNPEHPVPHLVPAKTKKEPPAPLSEPKKNVKKKKEKPSALFGKDTVAPPPAKVSKPVSLKIEKVSKKSIESFKKTTKTLPRARKAAKK